MHLAKVNACAEAFGIEVRHTVGEGFRAWGDINRMQDLVDAPCGRLITPTMHRDFGRQFESLDAWVVQCLRDRGIGVDIDGPGGGFTVDEDAPTELVDQCLNQAYEQFRTPPPQAAG